MSWYAKIIGDKDAKVLYSPINLCNHAYWNLSGDFKAPTIGDHYISVHADHHLDLNDV